MQIQDFIVNLAKKNFTLVVENKKLILKANRNLLSEEAIRAVKEDQEIIGYIRSRKEELIEYLSQTNGGAKKNADNIESIYRLSSLQEGMLFHSLYDAQGEAYIMQFSCDLSNLDLPAFQKSWDQLLKQHSILRSAFYYDAFNIPVQCVYMHVKMQVQVLDLRNYSNEEQQQRIREFEEADSKTPFSFKTAPVMRVTLLQLDESSYRMVWTRHHILFDGWSLPVLMDEFLNIYEAIVSNTAMPALQEDRYEDYIRYIERQDKEAEEQYWSKYLQGIEGNTLLPFISAAQRNKGIGIYKRQELVLDEKFTTNVNEYSRQQFITVNTLMQGVWAYLLHQYTGNHDIVYGATVSGRPEDLAGIERRVGMYINTLPVRSVLNKEQNIAAWFQQIQQEQAQSRQYQHTSLSSIREWTGITGDIFDSIVVFENYPIDQVLASNVWQLQVDNVESNEHNNFPLSVEIGVGSVITVRLNYNSNVLPEFYAKLIAGHFEQVLLQVIAGKVNKLDEIRMLTAEEKQQLDEFNSTYAEYPRNSSIPALFVKQVAATPNARALVFAKGSAITTEQLTYRQLDERSNQVANYLVALGIEPGDRVGLLSLRSTEMIIGMLGILKSGAVYVPFNTSYPAARLQYIVENAGIGKVLYTDAGLFADCGVPLDCGIDISIAEAYSSSSPAIDIEADAGAYVMYTSGTTGNPKGILVTHKNIVKLACESGAIRVFANDHVMQWSNYAFDGSTYEIYNTLLSGACLHMIADDAAADTDAIADIIKQYHITVWFVTPALFNAAADADLHALQSLRLILLGGEAVSVPHITRALAVLGPGKIANGYGPTETTVFAITYLINEVGENGIVPIGKPLSNTQIQILNEDKLRVPIGVTGELYIGGEGVSLGYVNNEELTKEKFISINDEATWYKTGDFARWLPDGSIEFIGRKDNQVKMRGYRIELDEIEAVLQSAPGVLQAVVIIKEDQYADKKLVGYAVIDSDYDEDLVKKYMQEHLPAYMVPDILMQLDQMPLTSNGKVDRKNLPAPEVLQDRKDAYVAPRNKLEQELADIWQDLLDVEKPGIHENFFELGGHSLLAIRLISAIRKNIGKEVSIKDVFDYPTIAGLSAQLQENQQQLLLPVIQNHERTDTIPLSFAQERLWFIDRLQGSVQYHMTWIFRLGGTLDVHALENAFRTIVNRHEILRTVIKEKDGTGMQVILPADEWRMEYISKEELSVHPQNVSQLIEQKVLQPFDLANDTMLRVTVVQEDENEYRLLIVLHHIAFDGWSISVMVQELVEVYSAVKARRDARLKLLPIQYADYAMWQRSYLSGETLAAKLDYWKKQLQGITPLELPADHPRPAGQSIRGGAAYTAVSKEIQDALNAMAQKEGVTLFMVLLSTFKVLLYRYTGRQDICVGTPVAGRQQQEVEGLIGFFVNTLALRNQVNGNQDFKTLLQQVRQTTLQAYEHQDVPFEKVVEALGVERDMSSTPVFQVTFALENMPDADPLDLGGVSLLPEGSEHISAQFDLSFDIGETADGLRLAMTYCSDIFEEATIVRMLDHYTELLQAVVADSSLPVGKLPMLTPAEQELLLEDYNDNALQFPAGKTVINLFEEQVSLHPQSTAVMYEQQSLTYQELDNRANQLAHYLMALDAGKEKPVGICLDRTPAMIVSILGILKAGSAYVPIDPSYPADRKAYMLSDSDCSMIITSDIYHENIRSSWRTGTVISLDEIEEELNSLPAHSIKAGPLANNLAYIIYTSGSTGMPKGVMVEHASVSNLIHSRTRLLGIDRHERILQFYNFSFDVSVEQVFLALCNGAVLVLLPQHVQMDSNLFESFLQEQRITHFDATPGFVSNIQPGTYHLKRVICGGEVCPATLAVKWATYVPFYNAYGPTETTVTATTFQYQREAVSDNGNLPIGKPGNNLRIYITDRDMNLVPEGVAGELLIGGIQVARAYRNNDHANANAFIADPFMPGERVYRTGDLAKWLPGGNLVYLGRLDEQVKVRGYRVEPAEVERALLQSPGIEQAVVIAKADKQGNKRLIAYVVTEGNFDKEKTAEHLRSRLPEYMVPGMFITLPSLPLNANGKVDKTQLPLPDDSLQAAGNFVEAGTTVEKQLVAIWQQLLGLGRIGITDIFFELGGHSLMAMRLVSAIRNTLHCELPIREIFYYPTIAGLSQRLAVYAEGELLPPVARYERSGSIPLSFAQERLWFIDRLKGSVQYHFSCVFTLTGALNINALEYAFKEVLRRHEVLRTVITDESGQGRQLIKPVEEWQMQYVSGSSLENENGIRNYIDRLTQQPYDLSKDAILRASLISLKPGEHILAVVLHHIAFDGWSVPILVEEFTELYRSFVQKRKPALRPLPIQYADYAIWQRQYLSGQVLESKLNYWRQKLSDLHPLQLPTDHKRPAEITTRGSAVSKLIDKVTSDRLQKLSQQEGTTLFMTLLTVFKALLHRYTAQQDICVGTPVAGRQQTETEGLIGFFNNMLSLRSNVNGKQSFRQLLQQVKETTLEAYEHEDVPFEKVVEALGVERDRSRSPIFQVAFVFQNVPGSTDFDLDGVTLTAQDSGVHSSHYDLNMDITESASGIRLNILYATDLFVEQTVTRMLSHYEQLLLDVLADADTHVEKMQLLTEAESRQLLTDFNNTSVEHRRDNAITLFKEQVAATPDALAVFFKEQKYSYKQLDDWSEKLAHYLRFRGVQQGHLVPVCMTRSPQLVAGILGILKAGASYIPVDPAYPADRINYMITDAGAHHILTSELYSDIIPDTAAEVIFVENAKQYTEKAGELALADPDGVAYIIYTSGTTGNPKGVMISHASLSNLTSWHKRVYNLTPAARTTLLAGVGFDASVWEMWSALLCGASIFIIEDEQRLEVETLVDFYTEHGITHSFVPTALVKEFIGHANKPGLALQYLLTGGDQLPAIDTSRLSFTIVNNYGPTENTVVATYYPLHDHNSAFIPLIGKPVDNTRIYILDDAANLQPVCVPGELCIGGKQVAMGYLNQPSLTSEKFVDDPFVKVAGAKMYRSGDLARWMPDGNIEFLGRKDDQVKIRGYRVELGEIESVLQNAPGVQQAVVVARAGENNENKRLIAYVVPDAMWNKAIAIEYLQSKLPEYMVPAVLMELEELPITANGKVDKKQLPDPDNATVQSGGYHAPRNEAEQQLVEIWEELLGTERIGIHDNFFELGGDSIITIQVVSRARRQGLDLQVGDLFSHQTIAALSAVMNGRSGTPEIATEQETLNGSSGLLPIQQWYFENEPPQISHYNQSVLLAISKKAGAELLQDAIGKLMQHHDALRFRYTRTSDGWRQDYRNYVAHLQIENIQQVPDASLAEVIKTKCDEYQQSLDIENGILLRAVLFETPEHQDHNRLLIVVHHLAIDGVSWRILLEDLELLLTALHEEQDIKLGNKTTSYRSWHEALERYGQSNALRGQKNYWSEVVQQSSALPVDKKKDQTITINETQSHLIRLGSVQTKQLLQEVPKAYRTEINDILMAALCRTICKWTNDNNIVIGLEGHGREAIAGGGEDVSRTVGWFTNMYPVMLTLETEAAKDESALVKSIKEQLRKVPEKGMGYGVLKYICKEQSLQGKDPWQIVFNYLGQIDNVASRSEWFSAAAENAGENIATNYPVHEKIAINSLVTGGELMLNWTYSTAHYEHATIQSIADAYVHELHSLITHCAEKAKEGSTLTPSDLQMGSVVNWKEFDRFMTEQVNGKQRGSLMESMYALSGLQEGMLFHGLYDDQQSYVNQFICDLADLNVDAFTKSWGQIIASHSILRTAFYHNVFSVPVQCVYKQISIPVTIVDLRDENETTQQQKIRAFEATDRGKTFDFRQAPLMRVTLLRITNRNYRMIWTHHHIIFDGWSMPVLMEEFLQAYESIVSGKTAAVVQQDKYEDYIRYIGKIDHEEERAYWQSYLQGVEAGSLLPFVTSAERTQGLGKYETLRLVIDNEETRRVQAYAQQNRITVSALMQGLWSLLLSYYTNSDRVTFGVIVSGRPEELGNVEKRVGLYISTLPLHAIVEKNTTVADWLQQLQQQQVQSRKYQYTPLSSIREWTGITGELFDSLIVFENYPVDEVIDSHEWQLQVRNIQSHEHNNYPLSLEIGVSTVISICFNYNASLIPEKYIELISRHFSHLLHQVIDKPGAVINDLHYLPEDEERQLQESSANTYIEFLGLEPAQTKHITEDATPQYEAPRNAVEEQLANIWRELLEIDDVSIHDNFFTLGGHSLTAIRLISAIRKELHYEISIREVFDHPTIAALAKDIEASNATPLLPAIQPRQRMSSASENGIEEDHIPLSFAQERLWFIHRLQGSVEYHMPWTFRLHGELDVTALESSFREILMRHEVLRSFIREKNGEAQQVIAPAFNWKMDYCSIEEISSSLEEYIDRPFDLSNDYLLRVQLMRVSATEHLLVVVLHHIAFDGWSIGIMVSELTALYRSKLTGEPAMLKELPVQYSDYAIWQRHYLSGDVLNEKLEYWKNKLQDVTSLELPFDRSRAGAGKQGAIASGIIDKHTSDRLVAISNREGTTLFMTLLAAFKVLLHRYCGQQDICIGTPIAGRQQQETEGLIGLFVNSLALRTLVQPEHTFKMLLQDVKQTTLDAYAHQDIPFEKVVEATVVERFVNRNPLFQVMFSLRNMPEAGELDLGGITLVPEDTGTVMAKLDITLDITETPDGLQLTLLYNRELFNASTIDNLLLHYPGVLQQVSENIEIPVGMVSLLTKSEEDLILNQFNALLSEAKNNSTVISLFEEQAKLTPSSTAVVYGNTSQTYAEINEAANRLANYLHYLGIGREDLIPVCMDGSIEMITTILAAWKAGAAYVPIDPAYPAERINFILQDTGARMAVTTNARKSLLPDYITAICIDDLPQITLHEHDAAKAEPQQLAYIIYTSGSTGQPKGVMVEHASLLNYVLNCKELYVDENAKGAGSFIHLSFTFDASLTALTVPLLCGKYVVISSRQGVSAFEDENLLQHAPYDFIKLTPAHLSLLADVIEKNSDQPIAHKLVVGGEALQPQHFSYFSEKALPVEIINEYGPTEAAVACSVFSIRSNNKIPLTANGISIGKPMRNTRLYIMDGDTLAPVGVAGELCIAGVQVARGYLNQPKLTDQKFVTDPFIANTRMYRTGDQARWLPDGNIEYLGRRDEQVKIRGYRVEPGEIETVLQQIPGVRQAVVTTRENKDGSRQLIAFIVCAKSFDKKLLQQQLAKQLPDHMIPSLLLPVSEIPLTINGKVNRRQLLQQAQKQDHDKEDVPRNETEMILAEIWKELLGIQQVGIYDDFFELGGHSLHTLRMIGAVREKLGIEIPLQIFFQLATIESTARYIKLHHANTEISLEDYEEIRL